MHVPHVAMPSRWCCVTGTSRLAATRRMSRSGARSLTRMPFVHSVSVRFFEVDLQGVVFNMWYLAWFDDAMTAYLADLGFGYDAMASRGWDVQLVHTEVDW